MSLPDAENVTSGEKSIKEEILEVPSALFKSRTGFSFDIGGSCIKLAYAVEEKGDSEDSIIIRMATFATSQLEEAIMFLKERIGGGSGDGGGGGGKEQTVFTTGVGCQAQRNFINSALNIRLENVSEMECFVKAFRFIVSNFPKDRIFHDQSSVVTEYRDRISKQIQQMLLSKLSLADGSGLLKGHGGKGNLELGKEQFDLKQGGLTDCGKRTGSVDLSSKAVETMKASAPTAASKEPGVTKSGAIDDPYPCILAMIGSGGAIIKVERDKFAVMDGLTRCGRMFLGLGALLTGCKTFDELIDMASRGCEENLMVLVKQLKSATGSDTYSVMPDDVIAFCFGQAVGRNLDEFKKEDLAAALVSTLGYDLAQTTHLNSQVLQTNAVYFCGSFVGQSQLIRDTIGRYLAVKASFDRSNKGKPKVHHFLRFGGYLGALGCLFDNMNK